MKTIAYYALHYGKEYLAHSVRSVQDAVDEVHVLYSPGPSFGHAGTGAANPDTPEELRREAVRFATKPVVWHAGAWGSEGAHRGAAVALAREVGAGLAVAVDADELWDPWTLRECLAWVAANPRPGVRRYRARFLHFWRSLGWVCRDAAMPERVVDLRADGDAVDGLPAEVQVRPVYHAGYAQSEALTAYKWTIHGHQAELRPGWLDRFRAWRPGDGDAHPTNVDFWHPEPADPVTRAVVDVLLGDHPYYGLELIR